MSFFTTSITDKELFNLQIEIGKIILDCQKRLNSFEKRKADAQKYENIRRQVLRNCAIKIEKRLQELQK